MKTIQSIELVKSGSRNWYNDCLDFAEKNIRKFKGEFTSEHLIDKFNKSHIFRPAETRVWGAVIRKLKNDGVIKFKRWDVYKNPKGHGKPCAVWIVNK